MPYDDPDAGDPMELAAARVPDAPGADARMAEAVVDEYVRFGFPRDRLIAMFRDPFFRMTHAVWRARGDAWCLTLIDRVIARWRAPAPNPAPR